MIQINNIHKTFGDNEVLRGIDLSINEGEVVVILGASGSGKTTFLRCLNALEIPQQGSINFLGEQPLSVDFASSTKGKMRPPSKQQIIALRRKSGMVFQQYNLFPHKTALENIIEGPLVVQKKPLADVMKMAEQLLAKVGLSDKANAYPHELSGGQQQRIGIARAMAIAPELILFDEPTSALDPELVNEVLQVMKALAKEGQTMVVVTHEIQFAREVADRIVFIDSGKVLEMGKPSEVLDNPKHERTQRFLSRLR